MITSNFASIPDTTPGAISVSRYAPRYKRYKCYKALAPGQWYKSAPIEKYIPLYMEILSRLNPQQVFDDLIALGSSHEPILLCYEPPGATLDSFCHRRLFADWLYRELGIFVPEGRYINGACVANANQYPSICPATVNAQLPLF